MLDGNACRIHPVKPAQCAGFPNKWNFPGWRQVCEAVPVAVINPNPEEGTTKFTKSTKKKSLPDHKPDPNK